MGKTFALEITTCKNNLYAAEINMINNRLAFIIQLIPDDVLLNFYSSDYWNNHEKEKNKEWWIAVGKSDRYLRYLNIRAC